MALPLRNRSLLRLSLEAMLREMGLSAEWLWTPLQRSLLMPHRVARSSDFLLPLYQMNKVRKERLKETLDKLDPEEHAQVFGIINRYTSDYTKTQTGVFVSSDVLPDQCIQEMESLVAYFLDQRKRMDAERQQQRK